MAKSILRSVQLEIFKSNLKLVIDKLQSTALPDISTLSIYPKIGHFWDYENASKHTLDGGGKISLHAPTIGNVDLIQPTEAQRPSRKNGWLALGSSRSQQIGFVTDGPVSYHEIFTLVNYDNNQDFVNDSLFDGFATLIGGSTFGGDDQRITASSNSANLLTSYAVDPSGRIRINNAAESSTDVLPMDFSVVHACNFNGSVNHTDTISFGYAQTANSRGWTGYANCLILMNAETTEAERAELTAWLQLKKQLSDLPKVEPLTGDVAIVLYTTQSNGYYGRGEDGVDSLATPLPNVRYYNPELDVLEIAEDDRFKYQGSPDGTLTTGSFNNCGGHIEVAAGISQRTGKDVVLVMVEKGGAGFSNGYFNKGDYGYAKIVEYLQAARDKLAAEGKTSYVAHWHSGIIEVEGTSIHSQSSMETFISDLRTDMSDLINIRTPITQQSPTLAWRTGGDYARSGIHEIYKDYFDNVLPYAKYVESDATFLTNDDVFGNGDSTHYSLRAHKEKLAPAILAAYDIAINKDTVIGTRIAPQIVTNLVAENLNGDLEVYGSKTQSGTYLNFWSNLGTLTDVSWDIVVADDQNRTNETVLENIVDNGVYSAISNLLPVTADNKFYYAITKASYVWDDVTYTSEFVVQTKYEYVPVNAVAPVTTGFVIVGQTLSTTDGTWEFANSFTYQWKRDGVAISGATSNTYTVTLDDEGHAITCDVTANGSTTATSNTLSNFSVADLTPEFYLDPADASTITLNGSTQVAQIDDKSGNGNHFTQSSSSDQPEYGTRTLNGLPCLDFALGNYLVKENYSRPLSGDIAFFMVTEVDSLTGAAAALIATVLNIGGEGNFQYDAISTLHFRGRFNSSNMGASPIVNPINESNNNLTLHNVNIKSSQDLASINIGADPNKNLSGEMTGDLSNDVDLLIFCNRAINQFIGGAMGLYIGVEDVTDATREKIEWYCFKRFGLTLPSGHTYENTTPL